MVDRIERLRKIFDKKVKKIMERNNYVDLDEGEREAITECGLGYVRFWDKQGRIYTYMYIATENDVIILPTDYEGYI